jgi:transcription elongation factor Elf1
MRPHLKKGDAPNAHARLHMTQVMVGDVPARAPCPICGRSGLVYKTDTGYVVKCIFCKRLVEMEERK